MSTTGMKSASATATDTALVATPCELFGVYWRAAATAGTIVVDDGGTTVLTINTPAGVSGGFVPTDDGVGRGIICTTDLGVTLTVADGVTVIYK